MVNPAPGAMPATPGMPSVPMVKGGEGPQDASQDPNAKRFMAVFWSGAGQCAFTLDVVDEISAAIGAFFLALRQYPKVHTFAVWRMVGPNPEDVADPPVVYLALAGLEAACSKTFLNLTGSGTTPAAAPVATPPVAGAPQPKPPDASAMGPLPLAPVPLKSAEQGFGEMTKQMKDARRGGSAADPRR